ncbi:MAG TPA: efflux RND transporter periplasmic adaptor subunit [Bacteroidota bacterium]|nr:efflux RND transporter periplasmic adaptor subunit [Bacteroidota bacterium]
MNKFRIVSALAVVLALAIAALVLGPWSKNPPAGTPPLVQGESYYTCPMHPSVVALHPGACPVCGMALVKKVYGAEGSGPGESPGSVTVSAAQRVAANITTAEVRDTDFAVPVSVPGVISVAEPARSVVAARVRGRIVRLYVDRTGVIVRKGEPLLSLYSPDVASAEEEYLVARSGRGDRSGGVILEAARRRLRDRFGLTDEQVARLTGEADIRDEVVYLSPIAGTVVAKNAVRGAYVDEGSTLFELADLSRLWVTASVPEREIGRIRRGEEAAITVEAYPGEKFRGRVLLLEPLLEQESRSVRVRLEIANPDGRLRPNMYARVEMRPEPHTALVVPASAVLYTGERPVVWVETAPGVFSPREVETGATTAGLTEILGGLAAGNMVAATGGFLIDSESQLEASPSDVHAGHGDASSPGSHAGHGEGHPPDPHAGHEM